MPFCNPIQTKDRKHFHITHPVFKPRPSALAFDLSQRLLGANCQTTGRHSHWKFYGISLKIGRIHILWQHNFYPVIWCTTRQSSLVHHNYCEHKCLNGTTPLRPSSSTVCTLNFILSFFALFVWSLAVLNFPVCSRVLFTLYYLIVCIYV